MKKPKTLKRLLVGLLTSLWALGYAIIFHWPR